MECNQKQCIRARKIKNNTIKSSNMKSAKKKELQNDLREKLKQRKIKGVRHCSGSYGEIEISFSLSS